MTNVRKDASRPSRKILWLGLGIVVAIALYTAGWFYVAERLRASLPQIFAMAGEEGVRPECTDAEVRGYPFRFGLFCSATSIDVEREGMTVTAGGLRSAAQVYNPLHIVSELDGPLAVNGRDGLSARLDWRLLRTSTVLRGEGIERASAESQRVTVTADAPGLPMRLTAEVERLATHLRRNNGNLDFALDAENFASPLTLDASRVSLEATVEGGAELLAKGGDLRGRHVRLHLLSAELTEGGALSLSGDLTIDTRGVADGDLKIRIRDHEAVSRAIGEIEPELAEQIARLAPLLIALDTEPGDDAVTLPLAIRQGRASIGLLPLGTIPPL